MSNILYFVLVHRTLTCIPWGLGFRLGRHHRINLPNLWADHCPCLTWGTDGDTHDYTITILINWYPCRPPCLAVIRDHDWIDGFDKCCWVHSVIYLHGFGWLVNMLPLDWIVAIFLDNTLRCIFLRKFWFRSRSWWVIRRPPGEYRRGWSVWDLVFRFKFHKFLKSPIDNKSALLC